MGTHQQSNQNPRTPNDDRSDGLNPNNSQRQAAVDEHSRNRNPQDPRNPDGQTRPSNPPGQGGRS